ncbi:uncharacterized protein LY89DRAFT_669548 [Mollisia scopiformis]|uniref:DUF7702 domain-containing protein n=1 Tax=Mollisia scopiformis TaxID=149040 RepID=A0A194XBJ4_MOLSC|nr:uncharacterized protein LY89DRAFT_669548 [Mollisia scopiformis]KUJ17132.1 hypothetical protein LY89DRAFT_669548 [Mollisia scopiformis]
MVTYREGIAIVQVAFYILALIGGILLCLRHGFGKSSGWVLVTFSLLRLIGAIFEIIAVDHPTKQVVTGAIVCISIGLSPLALMSLGLLQRVNQAVGQPIPDIIYKGVGIGGLIALCLGVYGGTQQASNANATNFTQVNRDSKIAVVLFTIIFIITIIIFFVLVTRLSDVPPGEKRLLLAVALSLPFLAVRYLYALLADFAQNKDFNSFFGNTTIYLIMAVVMKFIVILTCEPIGFTLHKLPKGELVNTSDIEMDNSHVPVYSEDSYNREEDVPLRYGRGNMASPAMLPRPQRKVKGPISWLYYQAKDNF